MHGRQRVLASLAPHEAKLLAVCGAQAACDAQRAMRMDEIILSAIRNAVQQRLESAQGRTLAGLVRPIHEVQDSGLLIERQRLVRERAKSGENQLAYFPGSQSARSRRFTSSSLTSASASLSSTGSVGS